MNRSSLRTFLVSAGFATAGAASALAHLGSFSPADGYNVAIFSGSVNWSDVSYYNAGEYGANVGNNPGPIFQPPDTGLWRVTGQVGGFFLNSAARTATVGNAPPYPTTLPGNTFPAYIVGNHFPGRNNDGSNLALRNDTPAGTGPIQYDYSIDTYDTGGPIPSTVTSGVVSQSFYFMPDPGTPPNPGTRARDKFVMSLKDSLNNTGFQWGYADDNEVYWRTNTSGPWNYTGVYATIGDWDGVRMDIDLTNDTFGIDYYDVTSNLWSTMVPAGTPLGTSMLNFTTIGWELADAVTTGIGGKNFFDDFSFNIPEPTTVVLAAFGLLFTLRRRAS